MVKEGRKEICQDGYNRSIRCNRRVTGMEVVPEDILREFYTTRIEVVPEDILREFYRFDPKDHVLVSDYLRRKVRGEALPVKDNVKEVDSHDVYGGDKKPWEIFPMLAERDDSTAVYLFTTTIARAENPTTGSIGAWQVEDNGASLPVEDPRRGNQVVGFKKTFVYDDDDQDDDGIDWVMTEFTAVQPPKSPSLGYVLCKIEKVYYDNEEEEEKDTVEVKMEEVATTTLPTAAVAA